MEFQGERFDVMSVRGWREQGLGAGISNLRLEISNQSGGEMKANSRSKMTDGKRRMGTK
jgi:hypothetical protein